MLTLQKVCERLEKQGLGKTAGRDQVKRAADQLLQDHFDQELLEELLGECGQQAQVSVELFAHKVVAAEEILLRGIENNQLAAG
jgi:hypothetical protein